MKPHTILVRNLRKTKWEYLRNTRRRILVDFKGQYPSPNDLEPTDMVLKTAVITAF